MRAALLALTLAVGCGDGRSAVDGYWLFSVYTEGALFCEGELTIDGLAGKYRCTKGKDIAEGPLASEWDGSRRLALSLDWPNGEKLELAGWSEGSIFLLGDGRKVLAQGRRVSVRLGKPLGPPASNDNSSGP